MREEIEAAALFITRLVNKNLQQSNACTSTASSIHSHSSSASSSLSSSASTSSSSSASSDSSSQPDIDEQHQQQQQTPSNNGTNNNNNNNNNGSELDKVEQFRQCLTEALYERFHNHWFPDQPSKGQAYRCIRLNEWDRRDITLQKACSQCGIDYKDLQLPVELTLWVDPDEVTCRFGENKGSHCLVAKFKDGELRDNNIDIDINNIEIEIFGQAAAAGDRMRHNQHHQQQQHHNQSLHGSPQQHQHNRLNNTNGSVNTTYQYLHSNNSSGHHHHHHQSPQQHQHHHQPSSPQQPPHHQQQHHRATNHLGKTASPAIISHSSPYHGGYTNGGCDTNGNPIPYYYF